jgi:multiple sugar transport system permease protein
VIHSAAVRRRRRCSIAMSAIGVVVVGIFVFPLYWMVSTSLKVDSELFTDPPTWFPSEISFSAYTEAVFGNPQMMTALLNSGVISLGTMLLTLVLAAPGAYGLARLRLRWSGLLLLPFLIAQLLPTINLALPLFALSSQAGLVNSRLGLILANTMLTLPFA